MVRELTVDGRWNMQSETVTGGWATTCDGARQRRIIVQTLPPGLLRCCSAAYLLMGGWARKAGTPLAAAGGSCRTSQSRRRAAGCRPSPSSNIASRRQSTRHQVVRHDSRVTTLPIVAALRDANETLALQSAEEAHYHSSGPPCCSLPLRSVVMATIKSQVKPSNP